MNKFFKVWGRWHYVIIAFGDYRFSQPCLALLLCWDLLNDFLASAFEKKYIYICSARKCYIKDTNNFFEFSYSASSYIKSFIILNGHLLMPLFPDNKYTVGSECDNLYFLEFFCVF